MTKVEDEIKKTQSSIDKEYRQINDMGSGKDIDEIADESLQRIDEALSALSQKITEAGADISVKTRVGSHKFRDELEDLRNNVKRQKKEIDEKGIKDRSRELIDDIRANYNKIVEKYLKA